jgi:simple sugar transport system ATP-binding protein
MPEVLRVEGVAKRFGPVTALRDVNLRLEKGEVLGLLGDNGAGKSTLVKILCGFHKPDSGTIRLDGEPVELHSVTEARAKGIDTVYQDLALVDELSVFHNVFLNRELLYPLPFRLLNNREMRRRAAEYIADIGVALPSVNTTVARLSGGQRQAIAIARSVHSDASILLLDEPLAAMGVKEGAIVLDLIRRLRERGDVSIIMILHNYVHVFQACDRVNLLHDGRIMVDKPTSESSAEELTDVVVNQFRAAAGASQSGAGSSPPRPDPGRGEESGAARRSAGT